MYENYWNLREKPFRNVADKKFFYFTKSHEEAYLRLLYNIKESQGLFLLLGEAGCGKSLLAKVFMQDVISQGYKVALITNPVNSATEFLQQILYEFGMEFANKSKLELIRDLKTMLADLPEEKTCLLIIDEAHLIKNEETFEEIRLLLNYQNNDRFLITPILVGKTELLDAIDGTPLKERVGLQYQVQPLNCRETGEYIYYRMEKAGCEREIFLSEAIKEIHANSKGVPREINNICELALLNGYSENAIVIDQMIVQRAINDLKGGLAQKANLTAVGN